MGFEDEWTYCLNQPDSSYPKDGQHVWIKIWDDKSKQMLKLKAIFCDTPSYRAWKTEPIDLEKYNPIAKPEYWKPIEEM